VKPSTDNLHNIGVDEELVEEYYRADSTETMTAGRQIGEKKFDWSILTALITVALLVGGAVWVVHNELSKIDGRMGDIDKRMARLETAIRILSDAQGGNTKELVHEALTVARAKIESGNTESACKLVAVANKLIAHEKEANVPAPATFFESAVSKYRSLQIASRGTGSLADEAFKGTLQLAEYRSALTAVPLDFHPAYKYTEGGAYIGELRISNGRSYLSNSLFYGSQSFSLDGFELENVVFDGVIIHYNGGRVILRNVRFVNCTFVVPKSPFTSLLLEAVALGETSTSFG
jgi:hypothetical protein